MKQKKIALGSGAMRNIDGGRSTQFTKFQSLASTRCSQDKRVTRNTPQVKYGQKATDVATAIDKKR